MGMSASQARLLSLTARQHDVELRAQKLQADKLRLAADSDRVYLTYLNALNARKVQYSRIEADGSTAFRDATLAILENGAIPGYKGEASDTTYLLQNVADGSIYVTKEFADAFGIQANGNGTTVPSLNEWLEQQGCTRKEIMKTVTDYNDITSVNPVANKITASPSEITVPDADTYSLSGTLAAPIDKPVSGTYSCTAGGTTPTVSVVKPTSSPNTKTVVTSGTDATSETISTTTPSNTVEITRDEYIIPPQEYHLIKSGGTINSVYGLTGATDDTSDTTTYTFTADTKMVDLLQSDIADGSYGDFRINDPSGQKIACTYWYYTDHNHTTQTSPPADFTYRDYLDYLKEDPELQAANFDWWEDEEGIHAVVENGYTCQFLSYLHGVEGIHDLEKIQTNSYDVNINRNAIAENIYLARSIINETEPSVYTANHDSQITSILNEMQTAYSNYATDENMRQLVLFSEQLSDALASGDKTQIQNALNLLGNTITSDKYSETESTSNTSSTIGNRTTNTTTVEQNVITYSFVDSPVLITPETADIPD